MKFSNDCVKNNNNETSRANHARCKENLTLERLLGYGHSSSGVKLTYFRTEQPNALPTSWRCPGVRSDIRLGI
jgi:hypothetical protein